MKKTIEVLMVFAAITSMVFLVIVESFNNITLDDIGFALQLKDNSVWNFMMGMYFTWLGRFMGFLISGIQMKSYFLFNSMLPFSILLYILNIFLVSKSLVNFFKIKTIDSLIYAIILFQLYVYSMFDISSYFWMCTKNYTFEMSLGLFALSDLICNKKESILNYIILLISFAFLGCSYEIYSPIILLLMGIVLLYKLHIAQYNIKQLVTDNRKLVFAFFAGTLFFILMVIAPGNWVRLRVHSKDANLSIMQIFTTSIINCIQLVKYLFFRIHYFLLFIVLLFVILEQKKSTIQKITLENKIIIKRICFYLFIAIGLCLVSVLLNTVAIGKRMEIRAFNHINLLLFLFIAFSLFEISKKYDFKKVLVYLFPMSLMIIIALNLYNIFSNYPELNACVKSEDERIVYLNQLKKEGNKATIKLKELHAPVYHSIEECWKIVVPKYSSSVLLKPNEVSGNLNNFYNITYKKYYNLSFEVYTTLDYDL